MPRIAKTSCLYQESLQFSPVSFAFILPELHAKTDLWLGVKQCLHTLRRLAYEGDADSVRTLSQLQGSDQQKNTELHDLIRCGKAPRLAEAVEYCNECPSKKVYFPREILAKQLLDTHNSKIDTIMQEQFAKNT